MLWLSRILWQEKIVSQSIRLTPRLSLNLSHGVPNWNNLECFIFAAPRLSEKGNGSMSWKKQTINGWLIDSFVNHSCMVLEMNEINHVQHDMAGSGTLSGERQGGSGRLRRRHFQHQKSDLFKNPNRANLPSQNTRPSIVFEESKRYSSMKMQSFWTIITAL